MRSRQSICIIEQEAEAAGPVVANCEEAGRHTATSSQLNVQRQAIASKYQTNGRTAESASVHQRRGGKACAVGGEEGYKLEGVFPIISSVNKFRYITRTLPDEDDENDPKLLDLMPDTSPLSCIRCGKGRSAYVADHVSGGPGPSTKAVRASSSRHMMRASAPSSSGRG